MYFSCKWRPGLVPCCSQNAAQCGRWPSGWAMHPKEHTVRGEGVASNPSHCWAPTPTPPPGTQAASADLPPPQGQDPALAASIPFCPRLGAEAQCTQSTWLLTSPPVTSPRDSSVLKARCFKQISPRAGFGWSVPALGT